MSRLEVIIAQRVSPGEASEGPSQPLPLYTSKCEADAQSQVEH